MADDFLPPVVARFLADTSQMKAALLEAGGMVETFGSTSKSAFDQFAAIGQKAFFAAGTAAVAIGSASVKLAADFQTSMERLNTQAQVPQAAIAGLSNSVLDLAGKVGESPNSLAQALYHVESAFQSTGITSKAAMDIVQAAAEGARIGGADLVDVTNALDAAVVAGIPGVKNYQQVMGALNATVGSGDMTMQDLADALSNGVMPVVKNYGLSILDVGAALATFGDNNIRGAQAGTALRMAVQAMAVPIKGGQAVLESYGMSADQMAKDMQKGGLIPALQDLKDHLTAAGVTGDQTGQILTEIFGKRAGTGVAVLYDQLDRLKSKYGDITNAATGFGSAWQQQTQTFNQKLADLGASAQVLGIKLGDWLIPKLTETANFVMAHIDGFKQLAEVIGVTLVAAIGAYIVKQAIAFGTGIVNMIRGVAGAISSVGSGFLNIIGAETAAESSLLSFASGGALLVGVGAIVAAVVSKQRDFNAAVQQSAQQSKAWADTFVTSTKGVEGGTDALKAKVQQLEQEIVKAFESGNTGKSAQLQGQLAALNTAMQQNITTADAFKAAMDQAFNKNLDATQAAAEYTQAVENMRTMIDQASTSTDSDALKQANLASEFVNVVQAAQADVEAMVKVGTVHDDNVSRALALRNMLQDLQQKFPELAGAIVPYLQNLQAIIDKGNITTTITTRYVADYQAQYEANWGTARAEAGFAGLAYGAMAEGGIVDTATLALIGEAGRELVLPLNNMPRVFQLLNQAGVVTPFSGPTPAGGDGGGVSVGQVVININGSGNPNAVAAAVRNELVAMNRRVGNLRFSPR